MPYFKHDKTNFHYLDEGEGAPLLFLHGLGSDAERSRELLDGLPGLRLIAPDFRGHGRTRYRGNTAAYRIPAFADDMLALLDHLRLEKAVLGGVSLGAAVALNLAVRHPARVGGLILVRPAWLNEPFPRNLDIFIRLGRLIEKHGVDDARAALIEQPGFKALQARSPDGIDSLLRQLRRPQADTAYEALIWLPASVPFLEWEELAVCTFPALVLTTSGDLIHPQYIGRELADHLPQGREERLPPRYARPELHRKVLRRKVEQFIKLQMTNDK